MLHTTVQRGTSLLGTLAAERPTMLGAPCKWVDAENTAVWICTLTTSREPLNKIRNTLLLIITESRCRLVGALARWSLRSGTIQVGNRLGDQVTWDVAEYMGQTAVLEIVDQQTGSWGHVLVDEITFYGDATTPAPRSDGVFDFNGNGTFASLGWTATGGLLGKSPAQGTLAGQQAVSGQRGNFVNTFYDGDATTGTLVSPTFTITKKWINFLIGGGNAPGVQCINLKVNGEVVRTATGSDSEQLLLKSWDVTSLIGQSAVIEIVDLSTTGWGHSLVDEIPFSDVSDEPRGTNWMDWGPDYYAAAPFNGLPSADRTDIAWMNNWQYPNNIPTSPWRSMLSIPRKLSLKTINGWPTLIQQPVANWAALQTGTYSNVFNTVEEGSQPIPLSGKFLDITMTFSDRNLASSSQFGLLRSTSDLA